MIDDRQTPLFSGMLRDAMSGNIPGLNPVTPERLQELRIVKDDTERNQTSMIPVVGGVVASRMAAVAAASNKPINPAPGPNAEPTKEIDA